MKLFYNTEYYNDDILLDAKLLTEDGDGIHCGLSSIIYPEMSEEERLEVKEYTIKTLDLNRLPLPDYLSDIEERLGPKTSFKRDITPEGDVIELLFVERDEIYDTIKEWLSKKIDLDNPTNEIGIEIIWTEEIVFKHEL